MKILSWKYILANSTSQRPGGQEQGGAAGGSCARSLVFGGAAQPGAGTAGQAGEPGLPGAGALLRRFGDFCYDHYELDQMTQQAAALVEAGADGIVTGVADPQKAIWIPLRWPPSVRRQNEAAGATLDGRWRWPCTGPLMSAGTPFALETACQAGI